MHCHKYLSIGSLVLSFFIIKILKIYNMSNNRTFNKYVLLLLRVVININIKC